MLPAPLASSVRVSVPVSEPLVVGVNVTLIVQDAFAARTLPQLLVCVKFALATMLLRLTAADPVLLTVTACAALAAPTN